MDAMGNQPDEVTQAAGDAVSEAVELADREERQQAAVRGRGVRGWVRRLLARRPARAERAKGIRRLNATLAATARRGAHVTGRGASAGGRWLSAQVLAMAPRLPVRDRATLRAQFPGLSPDELASALIHGASRASGAVGMAVGAWAVLPFIPAAGVEITAETLAGGGIEIKIGAGMHQGFRAGAARRRGGPVNADVRAWGPRPRACPGPRRG